jgi:hypothetical protein
MKDDRGLRIAAQGTDVGNTNSLHLYCGSYVTINLFRTDTANNAINAIKNNGYLPGGAHVMRRLTDSDAWFVTTDVPDGLKMFQRSPMKKGMEGDFETGNVRYKVREIFFRFTDWRGIFGSEGAPKYNNWRRVRPPSFLNSRMVRLTVAKIRRFTWLIQLFQDQSVPKTDLK